jgi:hypothetical protein
MSTEDSDGQTTITKLVGKSIPQRKEALMRELNRIKATSHETIHTADFKFLHLFRTRLTEEGIPLEHANIIANAVDFNFLELNEEDDFLGDVALIYAEICADMYKTFKTNKLIGQHDGDMALFAHKFNLIFLTI